MATTCFFCQGMLSDYLEKLLPARRNDELQEHLDSCKACSEVLRDLQTTIEVASLIPSGKLPEEASQRIAEACQSGSRKLSAAVASRWAFLALVPLLLIASMVAVFPGLFPGLSAINTGTDASAFVRYYPLLEGAAEIVDEHGNWLHVKEPAMRSLWEEGGISPEEFEKSFTGKPSAGEEAK
jgi:predicted anti-sigma-YlaC factor YlaD